METPGRELLTWFKSTRSSDSGACVEIAWAPHDQVATRDSKNPDGPMLLFTEASWTAFLSDLKTGHFGS